MIFQDEKLRKVSSSIFQEFESPKDRSRPLEWRRAFNTIKLSLRDVKIITSLGTHDLDWDVHGEHREDPTKLIKPDLSTQTLITAFVDEELMRDRLYCAAPCEHDEQKDIFVVERPRGDIKVILKSSALRDKSDLFPDGVYPGSCFRMNYEPGEDYISFEMTIPVEQMVTVIDNLRGDQALRLNLDVHLLSFSYEVDDFLREYYHPRDLIIDGDPYAFVSGVTVVSRIGKQSEPVTNDCEESTELDSVVEDPQEPSDQEVLLSKQLKVLLTLQEPLNKILFVLWVLVLAVAANLFLK